MTADNKALNTQGLLTVLAGVKSKYPTLSWADLIVLAGHTAIEHAGGFAMDFCGGRTDAPDGSGSENLVPLNWPNKTAQFYEQAFRWSLSPEELLVLQAAPRTDARGTWQSSPNPSKMGVVYFNELLGLNGSNPQFLSEMDLAIRDDENLIAIADEYQGDEEKFIKTFSTAWNKLMNADFFLGWNNLTCPKPLAASSTLHYSSAWVSPALGLATFLSVVFLA